MVLADSHEISRVPHYSGTTLTPHNTSPPTRLSRPLVSHPKLFDSQHHTVRPPGRRIQHGPTTPRAQRPPPITRTRFSHHPLSLATTHGISLPTGTEMFHFPAFPPPPYTRSDDGNPAQPRLGSPIRTPPDQSSLANSPGHIAGRNVLHQLLMPRHPPNAQQN